jgi:hypothetical protein
MSIIIVYLKELVVIEELTKSHINNTILQIFFIYSPSILLTFLAVFIVNVAFAEEIVTPISGGSLPVPALNSLMKTAVDPPMELNLFNNNIYVTNNGSNIIISNATNTSVGEVPFESEFNPSDNKMPIMNRADWNSILDPKIDSAIDRKFDDNDNRSNSSEAIDKNLKFCYISQFGSLGTGNGQFNRPHDIVFDSKGFLYINDRELNNFQKFTPEGKFISKFGEEGEELGQYKSPYSMAMDANDNIYVLDRGNDRVVKVDTGGNVLGALYSFNGPWITNNDDIPENEDDKGFSSPEAMAIDKEGNFYLTDTGNNRVLKFDKNFRYISHFGSVGSQPGQFNHPHGIGIDSDGNIFINELNNPRIQKFTNDGKFIKQWGSAGTDPGQFTLPLEHLKVDKNDRVFITDGAPNPRVQVFDKEGNFLTQFGTLGIGNGQFKKPEHVAFDEKDNKGTVYVVDRGNHRIQTFLPCN